MKVLVFTNMYPTDTMPFYGSFVRDEAEALRRAGVDVDVYFVNGRANKLNYFGMPFGFAKRLSSADYDVVHVHHAFCGFVATMQKRVPVVWTFHEGEISDDVEIAVGDSFHKRVAYSKSLKQRVAAKVDRLIVVAEHLKEPLGRDDATTLPSGLDTERFSPMEMNVAKERLGLDKNKRYILFPSSPDRIEKRFHIAEDAVKLYNREHGDGVELICLDRVPHAEVPLYMNASEAMLMTSAFEASPVTVREALSCNVPVMCTDVGDARLILEPIDGCYVVNPDATMIAEALATVLSDPQRVSSRDAMAKYSLDSTARALLGIYEDVVGVAHV